MRFGVVLALLFVATGARAEVDTIGADAGDAWGDFAQQESALENTSTSDCETACKALESLARAAEHICSVAPEHCDEAKARLRSASDRVHAACPQCAVRAQAPAPPARAQNEVVVVQGTSASGGGCAGCATAPRSSNGDLALLGLGLLLLARIRRR